MISEIDVEIVPTDEIYKSSENIQNYINKHWAPIKGVSEIFEEGEENFSSQQYFLSIGCDPKNYIREAMYFGSRGLGKTVMVSVDYAMGVGKGYAKYNGIIFRQESKSLETVKDICNSLFKEFFGEENFVFKMSKADYYFQFWDGSKLYLAHGDSKEDYDTKFHGQEYEKIYIDEAGVRKDMKFYKLIKTCLRSSATATNKNIAPLTIRCTANPEGDAYDELESYFMPTGIPGTPVNNKVAIFGIMDENEYIDQGYLESFEEMTQAEKDAYRYGIKSERTGTFFAECFDTTTHFIKPFKIPNNWTVDRSLDWGTGSPFSVLWFAESNGESFRNGNGNLCFVPKGSIFVIHEYYGCKSKNELNTGIYLDAADLSQNILQFDRHLRNTVLSMNHKIHDGPADNSIWNDKELTKSKCVAKLLEDGGRGTKWKLSNKNKGSRKSGAEYIRSMLNSAKKNKPDFPHLYIFNTCSYLKTNLLNLKEDPANLGDVISKGVPDHDYDALRYRLLQKESKSFIFTKYK